MEDYTYNLEVGNDLVLGSHMLEVCPTIADEKKPVLDVQHLGIGSREDPARLIFSTKTGPAINVSLIDLGDRFRLLVSSVDAVEVPQKLKNLPIAHALWKAHPNLITATEAWILAGGAHHTVFSQSLTLEDMRLFSELYNIEMVTIDNTTVLSSFKDQLKWNDVYYRFQR